MAHLRRGAAVLFSLLTWSLLGQPAVKSFIKVADMVAANPFQVADPTPTGTRTATVMVQETAAAYALTNTWSGTNMSTLVASTTAGWAWAMLPIASGPNFYNSDGTLAGPRTVDLGSQSLFWRGPGAIVSSNINSFLTYANGPISFQTPGDVTLAPGLRLFVKTPYVGTPSARTGDALTLLNAGTGEADFRPLPSQLTIYNADSTVLSNRTVSLGGNSMTFKGPGPFGLNAVDNFTVVANQYATIQSSGNVILEAHSPGTLSLRTPNVVGGGAQQGQVLTLVGPNGVVEFQTSVGGGGTNIYNSDGKLTSNRTVDTTNLFITFKGNGTFAISNSVADLRAGTAQLLGDTTTIAATNAVRIQTPNIRSLSAVSNQVLTLQDPATGRVEYQNPAVLPTANIYNSDGTLTGDRTVQGASKYLVFTNTSKFSASGQTAALGGSSSLQLVSPKVYGGTAAIGQVPILQNATNGTIEFGPDVSLYSTDGTLLSDRMVQGASKNLSFSNFNKFEVRAVLTNTIGGSLEMNVRTPGIVNASRTNGMLLSLINSTNGTVEFTGAPSSFSTNIYNTDGVISAPNGDRTVYLGTNRLIFQGASGTFQLFSLGSIGMSAKTNVLYASEEAQVGGSQRFKVYTPRFGAGAAQGHVLTLVDPPNALSDFYPANNLYSSNGMLAGNRIVEGNLRDLSLTNINVFDARGKTSVISGSQELDLRTPNVAAGSATTSQFLKLMDTTTGRAEYSNISFPTDVSVYTQNGTVTDPDRLVNINPNGWLRFIFPGSGLFQIYNGGKIDMGALTNSSYGNKENNLSTSTKFRIQPPRVWSLARLLTNFVEKLPPEFPAPMIDHPFPQPGDPRATANVGMVLTMENPDGQCDWYWPTNFFFQDGTLTGNRIVSGNGKNLNFQGINTLYQDTTNWSAFAKSSLVIGTPKIQGIGGVAANGWVLTLQDFASGRVEFAPAPQPTNSVNIYNSDGVLTGHRQVSSGGYDLTFNQGVLSRFRAINSTYNDLYATTNQIYSSQETMVGSGVRFRLNTPQVYSVGAAALAGRVLTVAADGTSEFQPLNLSGVDKSIYTHDGTLDTNRTVTGAGKNLTFTGVNQFDLLGVTTTLSGSTRVNLKTPLFGSRQGQFLQLVNQATGEVEYNTVPPVNIYNTDGTISGGNRQVTINSSLIFNGTGTLFSGTSLQTVNWQGTNVQANASGNLFLTGTGAFYASTPNVVKGTGGIANGQVLTLQDATSGRVEYAAIPYVGNIYTTNGTISSNRSVSLGGNKTLTFQGPGNIDMNSLVSLTQSATSIAKLESQGELVLGGQTSFRVRTPRVQNKQGIAVGQVLTLKDISDSAGGTAEFEYPQTAEGAGKTYYGVFNFDTTSLAPNTMALAVYQNQISPGIPPQEDVPEGTRLFARIINTGSSGTAWASAAGVDISISLTSLSGASPLRRRIIPPQPKTRASLQLGFAQGVFQEQVIAELVYVKYHYSDPAPDQNNQGCWVMVNSGWKAGAAGVLLANLSFNVTNAVSGRVSSMSVAGVVDTAADIPDAPLDFKKVSTLGLTAVGDGQHADYYQAAYDPNAPVTEIVRSSVDLNRMWRRLNK